jgi:hypothetical protein
MSSFPQGWQYPQPPTGPQGPAAQASILRSARPAAMRRAVNLMYAGAAVGAVSDIAGSLATHRSTFYFAGSASTNGSVEYTGALASGIIGAIIVASLWLWMAWKTGAGRNWARILSSVFFGFECLGLIVGFAALFLISGGEVVSFIGALAGWGIGLAALILLWQPASSQFFTFAEQLRLAARYGAPPPGYPVPGYGQPPQYGQPGTGEPPA